MKKLFAFLFFLSIPAYAEIVSGESNGGSSGVTSINSVPGAFTFSGSGVSCSGTGCTFSGSAGGTVTLGTSSSSTNPQRSGQATTGLFSNLSNAVAISNGGQVSLNTTQVGVTIGSSSVAANPLDIYGASAFGTYAGATLGTANQLAVSGPVTIGTTTPTGGYTLTSVGGINVPSADTFSMTNSNGLMIVGGASAISGAKITSYGPIASSYNSAMLVCNNSGSAFTNNTMMGMQFLGSQDTAVISACGNQSQDANPVAYFAGNGFVGIGSSIPRATLDLSKSTDSIIFPIGATGTRSATPVNGMERYNSTNSELEAYVNNAWNVVSTPPACQAVTASAGAATANWISQVQGCAVLTANGADVTVTLSNPASGGSYTLGLCNDTTARAWTLPAAVKQAVKPIIASTCTYTTYNYDGTNYQGPGSSETASIIRGTERAAPSATASTAGACWWDSTSHVWTCNDNGSGSVSNTIVADTGAANNFLTAIASTGVISKAQPAFTNISGTATVAQGGTGLTTYTSGGIVGATASGTLASSVLLTQHAIVIGAGAGATPTPLASLGTSTTVLHGAAAGNPTFGAVSLSADVSGNLPVTNLNSGTSASSSTFWRGDGTWSTPAGGSGGGGTFNYSDNGVTVTANTYFIPIGGGGVPTTTEANVSIASPAALTVAHLKVSVSVAPGTGNSYTITLRDGGVDNAVTCAIADTATSCADDTHSFNVSASDLIDWKFVSAGTIVTTPTVNISSTNGTSNVGVTSITTTAPLGGGPITTSGPITCTTCATTTNGGALAGTANQIDLSAGGTFSLDPNINAPGNLTITAAGGTPTGSFVDQIFTPIINTSDATDQLTSNGANQFFSMNSNAAVIPANTIVTGKRFTINYVYDQIVGATDANVTLTPVLCSVAGCGSGTVVPIAITASTAQNCIASTTCADAARVTCMGTAAAGSTATIICSAGDRMFAISDDRQSAIVPNVPTNGALYVNLKYNQATQTGLKASMIALTGDWDR